MRFSISNFGLFLAQSQPGTALSEKGGAFSQQGAALSQQGGSQSQQDAVLRAINESVSRETSPWVIVAMLTVAALGVAAVAIYNIRQRRQPVESVRKVKRNARKLLKEVSSSIAMSPADLRKLEHHAARSGVENPLTLLLCPSLVRKLEETTQER